MNMRVRMWYLLQTGVRRKATEPCSRLLRLLLVEQVLLLLLVMIREPLHCACAELVD